MQIPKHRSCASAACLPRTPALERCGLAHFCCARCLCLGVVATTVLTQFMGCCPVQAFSKLTPEDRLDITELCHRFDQAINRADHTAAGKLFAAHAQVHHPRGTVQGTENIVAYFKSVGPMAKGNRHLTVDMVIDPSDSGNRATATSYRLLHKAALPTMLLASGTIEDEFVKEDGSWHFLVRKFIMDPPVTPPAAAQ